MRMYNHGRGPGGTVRDRIASRLRGELDDWPDLNHAGIVVRDYCRYYFLHLVFDGPRPPPDLDMIIDLADVLVLPQTLTNATLVSEAYS